MRHIDTEVFERVLEQVVNIDSELSENVDSDVVRDILKALNKL